MRLLGTLLMSGVIATPASAATDVVRWSPFIDGALRPGLVATPAFGGDCFTGSLAVHNAYRCADGNFLRDPCFADPTRDDAVLCVRDPFSRGVVRLRVSGHLDRSGSAPRTLIWAVRLASGERCSFFAGGATSADAAGRRANYGCSGRQTILWGNPIRSGLTWRIRLSHSFVPGPERLAAIQTAYIGLAERQESGGRTCRTGRSRSGRRPTSLRRRRTGHSARQGHGAYRRALWVTAPP